ncbi:MAG TPA: discoidin domain-containing protein [Burkholderiales bacterium]|nr:discoidin domain-containing protein [Burkholderiales bacterium]
MQLLDDFHDLSPWQAAASNGVEASLRAVPGSRGKALCLDFDFGSVSGYAVARRELPLDFPQNFEFVFGLRGDAPPNALQFKLIDASGENVWWVNRPDFAFPHEWQNVRFKRRHIEFAWGPTTDRELRHTTTLELVVARGQGGGKGSVCFEQLTLRELPAASVAPTAPKSSATSSLASHAPASALDSTAGTAWRSDPADGAEQTYTLDFQEPREFGGLVVRWLPGLHASRYDIEFSDDGANWRTVRQVKNGEGGIDPHLLTESETRFLRLRLVDGPAQAYGIAEIEVKDLAFGASANAFFSAIARDAPRGHFPRGFSGEQSYWTVVGINGGTVQGLLSEDGALEPGPRAPALEPFLLTEQGLVTWADVTPEHSLQDDYLPIPTVTWRTTDLALHVTAFGIGTRAQSALLTRYRIENRTSQPRNVTLALALRPFQVNPPTQFLNATGGVAPIRALRWDGSALAVNGERRFFPLTVPGHITLADSTIGSLPRLLDGPTAAAGTGVSNDDGLASGALTYRLELAPHGSREIGIVAPLTGEPLLPAVDAGAWLAQQQDATAAAWRSELDHVRLRVPPAAKPIADTLRTALAHMLLSRNGPALQPGTRAYARSWIRDGAMMSDGLLRLGHASVVREYIDWFVPHQFSDGKVPCCVDHRGADPVVENDSHGELVYLIAQYYRYTHDRDWLAAMWPHVAAAVGYMNALREKERRAENETPARRAYYGLMPPSISHEGYSDRPAYSYWDDFWTVAGYASAVAIAEALGRQQDAATFARERDDFRRDLDASIRASIAQHGIDYIPGSADRGDFDATSTTIGLSIAGMQAALPRRELDRTFERYWQAFLQRRGGSTEWKDYTPYELRSVGAFVRLGRRDRAIELVDGLMADRRPAGWNQWAEVVGRLPREPRFIGDMPHGWIASDFVSAALDLFAYERQSDGSIVLAGGVPTTWLAGDGIAIADLRTPYGRLSYELRSTAQAITLDVAGGLTPPPGGLVFAWPSAGEPWRIHSQTGDRLGWKDREVRLPRAPASVSFQRRTRDAK